MVSSLFDTNILIDYLNGVRDVSSAAFPAFQIGIVQRFKEIRHRIQFALQNPALNLAHEIATSGTTGLLPLVITTSSPANAAPISCDKLALTAWILNWCAIIASVA